MQQSVSRMVLYSVQESSRNLLERWCDPDDRDRKVLSGLEQKVLKSTLSVLLSCDDILYKKDFGQDDCKMSDVNIILLFENQISVRVLDLIYWCIAGNFQHFVAVERQIANVPSFIVKQITWNSEKDDRSKQHSSCYCNPSNFLD